MGHIVLTDEGGEVTSSGGHFLSAFGADLRPRTRRIFCQPCLDWSERRYHLKGLVGARILDRLLELGWLKCVSDSRALQLTSSGKAGLSETFQIEINNEGVLTAIGCSRVVGEVNIAGNEVMDTGSGGGAQASSTVDYGIAGDLILEARVEGNLVTYSNVLSRDPQREDRALVMRGLLDDQVGELPTTGFAIQILGNKFIGTGRTALVELRETQLSNTTFIRFERFPSTTTIARTSRYLFSPPARQPPCGWSAAARSSWETTSRPRPARYHR